MELLNRLQDIKYIAKQWPWTELTLHNANRFLKIGNIDQAEAAYRDAVEFMTHRDTTIPLPDCWYSYFDGPDEFGIPIHVNKVGSMDPDKLMESCNYDIDILVNHVCNQIEKVLRIGYEKYPNSFNGSIEVWDLRMTDDLDDPNSNPSSMRSYYRAVKAIYYFSGIKDILLNKYPERVRKIVIISTHWILDYVVPMLPERTKNKLEFRKSWPIQL